MKTILPAALAAVFLSACSSVSVKDFHHTAKVTKPRTIYVAPFDTAGATVNIGADKTGTKTPAFKQLVAGKLQDYTVQNVTKHVAPAVKVSGVSGVPNSGWLVTGRFTRINSGNKGMRMIVGLGAGGSKMETSVQVFDLATRHAKPFLEFSTTGGTNAMPGLLTSGGPGVGTVYNVINAAASGSIDDAARTSRMIAGALSEYYGDQGWIAKDKVFHIKKPGEYQLVHGM